MSILKCFLIISLIAVLDAARLKCDYTFHKDAGVYLSYKELPMTFNDASYRCASEGAVLASPINDRMRSAMTGIMKDNKVENVLTGIAHATADYPHLRGVYYSTEGVRLDEIPHSWAPGEPDNKRNNELCISMMKNGTLADVRCYRPSPYFCSMKPHLARNLNPCGPKNYTYNPTTGSCYKLHNTTRVYDDAANVCVEDGGYLAVINSDSEAKAVTNNLESVRAFIGFRFYEDYGLWMTIQGETITDAGYDKWHVDFPKNETEDQNCGAIDYLDQLINLKCNEEYNFICEKDPVSLLCN